MLFSDRSSMASPFNLPLLLASTTVPTTVDPAGKAVLPLTFSGRASVPRKVCPVRLVPEPRLLLRRITIGVPAGTTIGWGTGFGTGAGEASAMTLMGGGAGWGAEGTVADIALGTG